jgi:hypothetical protein
MASLNISKVAVGCTSIDALRRRQQIRIHDGMVPLRTRFRPKRTDELIGGSVYWIIKHRVAARQTILAFGDDEVERKTIIWLDPELIAVLPQQRRAHQGWRYLIATDAPADLQGAEDGLAELPAALAGQLAALALI